jgi:putative endonuclease
MTNKKELGREGEEKAVLYLKNNGYRIIERNFKNKLGEIDVIARQKDVICFVEVRSRQGGLSHGDTLESVGPLKQMRLSRLAVSFLKTRDLWGQKARFDVVSVSLSESLDSIVLIKDAFPVAARYSLQ